MDQSDYTKLTGRKLNSDQSARFEYVSRTAQEALEQRLGWPLDPACRDNQYLEIGKTRDETACFSADTSDLDPADAVQGKTRLYLWNPDDRHIPIDPALKVFAVKLVKMVNGNSDGNGVTYKTLDQSEYSLELDGFGNTPWGKYINFPDWVETPRWMYNFAVWDNRPFNRSYGYIDGPIQIAVDAEWGFADVPLPLAKLWADMAYYDLDMKRDIKSESMTSHSYTKVAHTSPLDAADTVSMLQRYAGPKGTATAAWSVV